MGDNLMPKNAKKFHCIKCDFSTYKESNWKLHVLTRKHTIGDKMVTNGDKKMPKNATKFYCKCGNVYNHRQGLSRHQKTCSNVQVNTHNSIDSNNNFEIDKELLIKMLLKNQEVMEKIIEIMPKMSSHTNYSNNVNSNNQFNIQLFLNEHCKNAMNLTDFIDSLPITASTYDSTIENGLTKTITNMITNGLNKLDILERPIHCTDATRKTLYVKEADIWEKDTELLKVVDGIKTLIRKKRTLISRWKDANRGWDTVENKQIRFTELICNIMTDVDFDEKETGKIVRSISKSVYLDSEEKKKYLC